MKKRILFISYYWPPSGKASLHWPLKIIEHLPKFDWEPLVLTVEEESFTEKDESLINSIPQNLKVYKTKVFEVFNLYKRFIGKKKEDSLSVSETMSIEKGGIKQRISMWVRMNLFIPDARITWYRQGIKGGSNFIKQVESDGKKIDAILSIGTPHSTHLIGRKLSKKFQIPHIPLFTDPWTTISYYKKFRRSKLTSLIDQRLERKVLEDASRVLFSTKLTCKEYENRYPLIKGKTKVLYWGYNESDFANFSNQNVQDSKEKVVLYSGNIFDYQNPINFWKTIRKKIDNGENYRIRFTGTISPAVIKSLRQNKLFENIELLGFLPYDKMIEQFNTADILLLCPYDERHVPGKLFEYLRSGKPIIAFCDSNEEVKDILTSTNSGMMFKYDSSGEDFFNNLNRFKTDQTIVKQFDRYEITNQLADLLSEMN